jgi:2-succinyl-6-hydroxy-2,4-cyclohexadiene-1-carboxylate synthase
VVSGPTLLHGFTGSAAEWGDALEGLRAAGFSPAALDLPGHGARRGEEDDAAFTLDATLSSVEAVHQPGGPLLGYSMGGRLALHFACRNPDRISRLVLESASPGLTREEDRSDRRRADARLADRIIKSGVASFVDEWQSLELFESQKRLTATERARVRAGRLANDAASLAAALRGLGTGTLPSLWERLHEISTPTLIIVGELDPKFTEIGVRMVQDLPDARLAVVPGSGHNVHLEKPAEWRETVATFLRGA